MAQTPVFDLYNHEWPILTWQYPNPPAKFVHEEHDRRGRALGSLVAGGVVVSGGTARRSILGPRVRINSYSEGSISFPKTKWKLAPVTFSTAIAKASMFSVGREE